MCARFGPRDRPGPPCNPRRRQLSPARRKFYITNHLACIASHLVSWVLRSAGVQIRNAGEAEKRAREEVSSRITHTSCWPFFFRVLCWSGSRFHPPLVCLECKTLKFSSRYANRAKYKLMRANQGLVYSNNKLATIYAIRSTINLFSILLFDSK